MKLRERGDRDLAALSLAGSAHPLPATLSLFIARVKKGPGASAPSPSGSNAPGTGPLAKMTRCGTDEFVPLVRLFGRDGMRLGIVLGFGLDLLGEKSG